MSQTKLLSGILIFLMGVLTVSAQENNAGKDDTERTPQEEKDLYKPVVGGTIRAKYEWQTEIGKGRFQVRTARLSISGNVLPRVGYKAEIDLSDKGRIKMLDAYTFLKPWKDWKFTIGQMRVPFTIDAHRGPHLQYFPNRSFIAKQVGSVRDVGATVRYDLPSSFPIILEGGLFNGSGLTNQDDFWTEHVNFSAKAQFFFPKGFNLTLSTQKTTPGIAKIMMYDAGAYWEQGSFHIEAEYLYKHYKDNLFPGVHSCNLFGVYTFNLPKGPFRTLSALARYDYMGNHSDGVPDETGTLFVNDAARSRLTAGVTLSFLHNRLVSSIRLNYEKYFYPRPELAHSSEKDKLVIEFMTHF